MWDVDVMRQAQLCVTSLQDMMTARKQQRSSVQHPASTASEDFTMAFMSAWCTRVAQGIMAHGPLLAHARQCGHQLVKHSEKQPDGSFATFLVPKKNLQVWTDYDWQAHGHDGLAAITKFLKLSGFWSEAGVPGLTHIAPPMVGQSTKEKNLKLLADIVPRAMWADFQAPRGVKMFIHDNLYLDNYSWSIHAGIPKTKQNI